MFLKLTLFFLAGMLLKTDNFPTISKSFQHTIKRETFTFDYTSQAGLREKRYYVKNTIRSNTRKEICLNWMWTGILCDNASPMIFEACKEMQVKNPAKHKTTIYFGANLKDPADGIECWIEDELFNSTVKDYKTSVCFLNEAGFAMSLSVTSSYIPQLKISIVELQVDGDASILCEQTKNLAFQDSSQAANWKINKVSGLDEMFGGSKSFLQISEFLQPDRQKEKTYFYCKKPVNSEGKLVFTSAGENPNFDDMRFCIFSETTKQKVAFSAKAFIPK